MSPFLPKTELSPLQFLQFVVRRAQMMDEIERPARFILIGNSDIENARIGIDAHFHP